jgi:hypothetical protein
MIVERHPIGIVSMIPAREGAEALPFRHMQP